jgi:hypothetical protein
MEFFYHADARTNPETLRRILSLDKLPEVCAAVDDIGEAEELGRVVFFCHWGRFHIRREEILGGVRFWVPDCPNALAWTVTTGLPPCPERVVIHGTINRTEHDQEFIEACHALLEETKRGLERELGVEVVEMKEDGGKEPSACGLGVGGIGDLRKKR